MLRISVLSMVCDPYAQLHHPHDDPFDRTVSFFTHQIESAANGLSDCSLFLLCLIRFFNFGPSAVHLDIPAGLILKLITMKKDRGTGSPKYASVFWTTSHGLFMLIARHSRFKCFDGTRFFGRDQPIFFKITLSATLLF